MGLYDIMDEIAAKQVTKTDTGDNRIMGVMVGIVAENYSASAPGRVCVKIPTRDDKANELKWARVAMPSGGSSWGHYFIPEVGDQVLLAFEQGNIEKPYVIGCLFKTSDNFLSGSMDSDNGVKRIVTKNGSTLRFDDNVEELTGINMDKITLATGNNMNKVVLDNEKQQITISDLMGSNEIVINSMTGKTTIAASNKLVIQVGKTIEVTMNGLTGTVSVDCNKFSVDASTAVKMKSDMKVSMSGSTVGISSSGRLALDSSGMAKLSGTPVKIG